MDREDERHAGRDGRRRRHPDDVDAAEQAGQRGRRATAAAPNSARPPRRWRTSRTRGCTGGDRRAAGDEGEPLVVGVAGGQRAQQRARVAGDAAPGEQGARVDTDLHRDRTV